MPKLKELDNIDGETIQSISDQLRHQVESFESALAARRKALVDAITIHTLTEKVIIIIIIIIIVTAVSLYAVRQSHGV